jgi:hypothetical protein
MEFWLDKVVRARSTFAQPKFHDEVLRWSRPAVLDFMVLVTG